VPVEVVTLDSILQGVGDRRLEDFRGGGGVGGSRPLPGSLACCLVEGRSRDAGGGLAAGQA
jgi:hypothetical protein